MENTSHAVDANRSALILVEFQQAWLAKDGLLHGYLEPELEAVVSNARAVLDAARRAKMHVVHAPLRYADGYPELRRDARAGLAHHIPRVNAWTEEGQRFGDDFAPREGEFVIGGRTASSAFAGSNMDVYLRANDVRTLYILGFALHVCVESTLRNAHDLGYEAIVITDASGAFATHQRKYLEQNIAPHYGEAISTETFVHRLAAVVG